MALCEVLARDPRYAIDVVSTIEKLDEQGSIHKVVVRRFELETEAVEAITAPKGHGPLTLKSSSPAHGWLLGGHDGAVMANTDPSGPRLFATSPVAVGSEPMPHCGSTSRVSYDPSSRRNLVRSRAA